MLSEAPNNVDHHDDLPLMDSDTDHWQVEQKPPKKRQRLVEIVLPARRRSTKPVVSTKPVLVSIKADPDEEAVSALAALKNVRAVLFQPSTSAT